MQHWGGGRGGLLGEEPFLCVHFVSTVSPGLVGRGSHALYLLFCFLQTSPHFHRQARPRM